MSTTATRPVATIEEVAVWAHRLGYDMGPNDVGCTVTAFLRAGLVEVDDEEAAWDELMADYDRAEMDAAADRAGL